MNRKNIWAIVLSLFLLLVFFWIFYYIAFYCGSDLPEHARFAILNLSEGDIFKGNFLLYFLMNVCSGFSYDKSHTLIALCFLLSASKVFLFWISFLYLKVKLGKLLSFAISISLLIVTVVSFNLFLGHFTFYLGYLVPNVWHNSTIIFSMPFCFLIYINSLTVLEKVQLNQVIYLTFLVLICVMIKPSFFFVYSCSFSLIVLCKFWPNIKKILLLHIPIVIGLLGVLYQYLTIYDGSDGSSVIIGLPSPPSWHKYWSVYGLYVLVSLAFPLSFFVLNYKRIKLNCEFWLVCLMLLFSIFIVLVFREAGVRANHGNFYWQIIPSMWIMFFYVLKAEFDFIKIRLVTIRNKSHAFLLGYYVLAFVFGLIYMSYYFYSGIYY